MCCMALCATQKWYFMVPPSPGRNWCLLLKCNTDKLESKSHITFAKYQGTLWGQTEEGWFTLWTQDRNSKNDLDTEIYLLYLSPLAPQIHHTRTDWAKESVSSPFNPPVSRINALTEKVSHAGILTTCPSHTPMSTHLKNSLLYISAFLKAWTML